MERRCGKCGTEMFSVLRCLVCESQPQQCPVCAANRVSLSNAEFVSDQLYGANKQLADENTRLRRSLEAAHFTDEGGEYWKPPVNHAYRELWQEKERLREAIEWACNENDAINKTWFSSRERTRGMSYHEWFSAELRRRAALKAVAK